MDSLLAAFARLPEEVRRGHQLVIACRLPQGQRRRLQHLAADLGVGRQLVLTGEVADTTLRSLYQSCTVFVFSSLYEGFGLPILEALHCGAAVVAGMNSAQPEVVGEAGVLTDVGDPEELAQTLARVLQDPPLLQTLRARARPQSEKFHWEETAARALEGCTQALRTSAATFPSRARLEQAAARLFLAAAAAAIGDRGLCHELTRRARAGTT